MITLLGIIANLLFTLSALPETISTIKRKYTNTPLTISITVILALISMWFYMFLKHGFDFLFTINYTISLICWLVLLIYGAIKKQ